jgi:hypothetical protein
MSVPSLTSHSTLVPAVAKLPVFATVARSYGVVFGNFGMVLRVVWFWCLLIAGLQWLSLAVLPNWTINPSEIAVLDVSHRLILSIAGCLNGLIILPAFASIAVTWHRWLLLHERPAADACIRLDRIVWIYAAMAAGIALVRFAASLPQVLAMQDPGAPTHLGLLQQGAAALLFLAIAGLLPRLSLGLPGFAVGAPDASLAAGFAAARANTWRLLWGTVLCLLPAVAVGAIAFAVWPGADVMLANSTLATATRIAMSLLWPPIGIVFVGFLSYAYEHLVLKRTPPRPTPAAAGILPAPR